MIVTLPTLFISLKDAIARDLDSPDIANAFRQVERWAASTKLTITIPTVLLATQQAGNYTFGLADAGTVVEGTSASAQTFTIPPNATTAFPLGSIIEVFQDGAGQVTIAAGTGVTLRSDGSKVKTAGQYATVGLRQRATNEWVLSGDLA